MDLRIPSPRRKVDGEWLCRWCGKPCPGRRSSWCSDECNREGQWVYLPKRDQVFRRDQGVCGGCGLDTERLERILRRMERRAKPPSEKEAERDFQRRMVHRTRYLGFVDRLEDAGFRKCFRHGTWHGMPIISQSLWEADHSTPRILGGTEKLDNYRTLCVPCHKHATRRLAKYRARRRKKQQDCFSSEDFR